MKKIVELLTEKNRTISTMESCTGGCVVNELTNVVGSSNVLSFSAVTYSDEFKIKMGVKEEIINKYTVYSMEVACEMSKKISMFTNSDYGVGITGILDNNSSSNIVYISVYDRKNSKYINSLVKPSFDNRCDNKKMVVDEVYKMLLDILS